MNEDIVIGIDLGTTNSCVCYYFKGTVKTLENRDGEKVTPSFIYFQNLESDVYVVGNHAKNLCSRQPLLGVYGVKRLVGRNFDDNYIKNNMQNISYQIEVDEYNNPLIVLKQGPVQKKLTPKEVYTKILKKLKLDAEEKLGHVVSKVVITVPAHFNVAQREVTLSAAVEAGFTVLKLLNEPTAAALTYYHEFAKDEDNYSLVFDLGGGTFDVAILKKVKSVIKILSVDGDSKLGGQDFDDIILNHICDELEKLYNYNPKKEKKNTDLRRIRSQCEEAKKALSSQIETSILLYGYVRDHPQIEIILTQKKLEELSSTLFQKTIDIMDNCLKNCNISKDSINEIIMAGGSTRIPKIKYMVAQYFGGKKLNNLVNPDECVAEGAALQAAMFSSHPHQKIEKIVLEDVVPLSLGIADFVDKMRFLIKRNSSIPSKGIDTYVTSESNQDAMYFRIFEGERLNAKKNRFIGDFIISDITSAPRGQCEVTVKMKVDENGIMTVTAKEKLRENVKKLRVNCIKGTLSEADISNFVQDAEKSKQEDELFDKFAECKSYLLLYCDAIMYNLKTKDLMDRYEQIWEVCSESKEDGGSTEFPEIDTIKDIIGDLESLANPIIDGHKFENVPVRTFEI